MNDSHRDRDINSRKKIRVVIIYNFVSRFADMAVQNAIGDSFRGATWVALHNGGGVGW